MTYMTRTEAATKAEARQERRGWPDWRIAALRKLHAENVPYPEIARRLGITKNAVSGKCMRLGLSVTPETLQQRRKVGRRRWLDDKLVDVAKEVQGPRVKPARASPRSRVTPQRPDPIVIDAPLPPTCKPVTILNRTSDQCPAVLGNANGTQTLMCGAPKAGGRHWCAYHQSIVYRPGTATNDARRMRMEDGL